MCKKNEFPFHLLLKMRKKSIMKKHGLNMKMQIEETANYPKDLSQEKVIPSGLIFLELVQVKYYFTMNNRKKCKTVYQLLEYIKAFV